MNDNSLIEECTHQTVHITVIAQMLTCETTVLVCSDCGKKLTEPETDSR